VPEARQVLARLLETSDVLFDNLSVQAPEQFGLTWEELQKINPRLVVVRMPGIALSGPYRSFASFGVTLQAFSGINGASGDRETTPIGPSAALPDYVAGVYAAMAIAAAVHQRNHTGKGAFVELSQFEASVNLLGVELMEQALTGAPPPLLGNRHASAAPHGVFRCRDEHLFDGPLHDTWCAIAVMTDEQWASLCEIAGLTDLLQDQSLTSAAGRKAQEDMIERRLSEWTRERAAWDVFALLDAAKVPVSVVESGADMLDRDEHLAARQHFDRLSMPGLGDLHYHGTPLRYSNAEPPGPMPGDDNDYVLMELLGMSTEEVAELQRIGAIT
jgi:benzylsuccinate CoA-transferase BbsF subunit